MTQKIISALSSYPIKVKKAFSQTPFCVAGDIPTVTIGEKTLSTQKTLIDGKEKHLLEQKIKLNVYTKKSLGAQFCTDTANSLLSALAPLCENIFVSEAQYNHNLLHFLITITLTLPKTEE